jgi:hypothetical protein
MAAVVAAIRAKIEQELKIRRLNIAIPPNGRAQQSALHRVVI